MRISIHRPTCLAFRCGTRPTYHPRRRSRRVSSCQFRRPCGSAASRSCGSCLSCDGCRPRTTSNLLASCRKCPRSTQLLWRASTWSAITRLARLAPRRCCLRETSPPPGLSPPPTRLPASLPQLATANCRTSSTAAGSASCDWSATRRRTVIPTSPTASRSAPRLTRGCAATPLTFTSRPSTYSASTPTPSPPTYPKHTLCCGSR